MRGFAISRNNKRGIFFGVCTFGPERICIVGNSDVGDWISLRLLGRGRLSGVGSYVISKRLSGWNKSSTAAGLREWPERIWLVEHNLCEHNLRRWLDSANNLHD